MNEMMHENKEQQGEEVDKNRKLTEKILTVTSSISILIINSFLSFIQSVHARSIPFSSQLDVLFIEKVKIEKEA